MTNRIILGLLAINLAGTGWLTFTTRPQNKAETFQWPEIETQSTVSYTYQAELNEVIDGDTVDLNIDPWF